MTGIGSSDRSIRTLARFKTFLCGRSSNDGLAMDYQLGTLAICGTVLVCIIQRHRRLSTIRDVPGPVNPSWIFGRSPGIALIPSTSSCRPASLTLETFKDISGISRPKKLGEQRRGSSKILGMWFIGTVLWECVSPLAKCISTFYV